MKLFKNAIVYVEGKGLQKCNLSFDETIKNISKLPLKGEELVLPDDAIVLPGFIDQHIHGAGGADTMDASLDALETIATTIAKEGTTLFLATTMTQSEENIINALKKVNEYKKTKNINGAKLLGVHLEGPFIAKEFKGAQPEEFIAKPNTELFNKFDNASGNNIKIVTIAPEVEGSISFIEYLTKKNIIVSFGHTKAKNSDIEEGLLKGATGITHTYNAQSPLHHREIGTVGSALYYDDLTTEIIADTIHVSVPAIKLLTKCKPASKVILITDAMRAKSISDGVSELGGQKVYVKNGEARLEDGTLAGSVLQMNRAIENMVEKVGIPFLKAVDYATINPAKNLKIDNLVGSIKKGKKANFTVINKNYDVIYTIRDGKIIYSK